MCYILKLEMKNIDGLWRGSYEEFWKGKISFCGQILKDILEYVLFNNY